jgi:soluble lytic murein transglycosylase-like protein
LLGQVVVPKRFFPSSVVLAAILIGIAPALWSRTGAVYKYTDRNGVVVYTNKAPPRGVKPKIIMVYCPACDPASKVDWTKTGLNLEAYADLVDAAARKHGVDRALVRAVMHAESAFDPDALSRAGAQGLMQLMPGTAGMYGVTNAFDPEQNIAAGVEHLRMLLDLFDGDVTLATAAYNAGENNVLRYGGIPPFAETQVYVERVKVLHQRYAAELKARAQPSGNATIGAAAR